MDHDEQDIPEEEAEPRGLTLALFGAGLALMICFIIGLAAALGS